MFARLKNDLLIPETTMFIFVIYYDILNKSSKIQKKGKCKWKSKIQKL